MPLISGNQPAEVTHAREIENAEFVRINRGIRPYGGRKLRVAYVDGDVVAVYAETAAGNSMLGADVRTYRLDEVKPARARLTP